MHQYIVDTEFATRGLIDLICKDLPILENLVESQKIALSKETSFDIAFMQRQMNPMANYWHGQLHEAAMNRLAIDQQVNFLEAQILDKKHSIAALSGAVLQIAKQGISSVRGRPENCPAGRLACGVDIKCIIWAGRNQALHFEQPKMIDNHTKSVFMQINAHSKSNKLSEPTARSNLAFDVFSILQWEQYAQYEHDLINLIG